MIAFAGGITRRGFSAVTRRGAGAIFLCVALLLFTLPVLVRLAEQDWRRDGAAAPIILVTGLWLLWHEARGRSFRGGALALTLVILILAIIGAVMSSIVGSVRLQWLCVYVALVSIGYCYIGFGGLRALWFPIAYLLFLLPPPGWLVEGPVTAVREWLCQASVGIMAALGYDVAFTGATIFVSQYEILVSDACSGMNSLFSLMALSLFYAYMRRRAGWFSLTVLAACALPVAILANLGRVLLLLLATHHFGDAFAQGPFHEIVGIIMFLIALPTMLLIDGMLALAARGVVR